MQVINILKPVSATIAVDVKGFKSVPDKQKLFQEVLSQSLHL